MALNNLGYVYALQGQFAEAMEHYQRAIALDPDYEQALLNIAALYLQEGKKTDARQILQRIIKINPENTKAAQILTTI